MWISVSMQERTSYRSRHPASASRRHLYMEHILDHFLACCQSVQYIADCFNHLWPFAATRREPDICLPPSGRHAVLQKREVYPGDRVALVIDSLRSSDYLSDQARGSLRESANNPDHAVARPAPIDAAAQPLDSNSTRSPSTMGNVSFTVIHTELQELLHARHSSTYPLVRLHIRSYSL